jgi:catechol 2,3-dioxygenase-like lactoylglutathione lyase family enzyme
MTRLGLHHIALTVADFEVSIPWYEGVFGIHYQMEAPHQGGVGKLLGDEDWNLVIVLHVHEASQGERFDERRTGLDHIGISTPGRAELDAFSEHLVSVGGVRKVAVAERPLTQSPIAERRPTATSWSSATPTTSSSRPSPHHGRSVHREGGGGANMAGHSGQPLVVISQ